MRDPEGGSFLGRWAARKAEARKAEQESERPQTREREREMPAKAGPSAGESPAAGPEAESEEELLARLGLPAPEELRPGDDFAAFMKAAIPDAIRRRALRRLWAINPDLANLDGLIDYGEDFTDGANVVEGLTTAWEAGKGYASAALSDEGNSGEEIEQQGSAGDAESATPANAMETGGEPADGLAEEEPPALTPLPPAPPEKSDGESRPEGIPDQDQDLAAAPRRMRFRFGEEA